MHKTQRRTSSRHTLLATLATFALLAAPQVADAQRSGPGPCRQGVLALMAMIDGDEHAKPDYARTAKAVVETCGPTSARKVAPQPRATFDKAACSKLALAMLDAIEESKINTATFTRARDTFGLTCRGG